MYNNNKFKADIKEGEFRNLAQTNNATFNFQRSFP